MSRKPLSHTHDGVEYTVRDLKKLTGLKSSHARCRMNRIIAGEITFEEFMKPARSLVIKKKKKPLVIEKTTPEQQKQLEAFAFATRNDDQLIKKYYSKI